MADSADSVSDPPNQAPDFIYSLHGIRTNALWQSQLEEEIRKDSRFSVGHRNYRRFDSVMLVLKNIFYHKPLRLVEADLRALQKTHRVSVIAHSFGTWLLLKALTDNHDIKVHHVILCGSVFPRATALWRQLKHDMGQITGNIVNFCGLRDPVPALAEFLSRDFGASGCVGAGDPVVEDSFHDLSHSGFLTPDFCNKYWMPMFRSEPRPIPPRARPRGYIASLLWMAAHRGVVVLAALLLGVAGYAFYLSEWSCYVRSCYIDVVRIQSYTSSTRQPGPRRYVNQIIFEYTFNFNLDSFLFRSAVDRNAKVRSFIGDQLNPITAEEDPISVKTADGREGRKFEAFRIPVKDRRAYFLAEFANDSSEGPNGMSATPFLRVRNLRGQIILPDGVSLVAPRGAFRRGILIAGKVQSEEFTTDHCNFETDGKAFRCRDLNVPPNTEFVYCFAARGWNSADEITKIVNACQPDPVIEQNKAGGAVAPSDRTEH